MFSLFGRPKRIALLLPSFAEHDAMSDYVKIYSEILSARGYQTQIFARFFPSKLAGFVKSYEQFKESDFDVLNYHHGIGDPVAELVKNRKIPVVLYYHNITPAKYYRDYNWEIYELLVHGRNQLKEMASHVSYALSASVYSDSELKSSGYKNTDIIPIFFDPTRLSLIQSNPNTIKYLDKENITNITFIGRFSAHKDQESLIKAFYLYHMHNNRNSRLNLVGSVFEKKYLDKINKLIEDLGIQGAVNAPGMVEEDQWRAYYEESAVFVSMSEHEGFFVPVLEANYYKTPVIAYDGGAVRDTMGDAGILITKKDPAIIAETINRVVTDRELRQTLINNGQENYKKYDQKLHEGRVIQIFEEIMEHST